MYTTKNAIISEAYFNMISTAFESSAPSPAAIEPNSLALEVSPSGRFHIARTADSSGLPAALQKRIIDAFANGDAHGLLHLGAMELGVWLPASLSFGRSVAHLFMARLCAIADLANQWAHQDAALALDDLRDLLNSLPPMVGAEYVTSATIAIWWQGLQQAARDEIEAENSDVQTWISQKHPSWNLMGRVCFHLAENKNNPDLPFAFLATYAASVSAQSRVQHQPLGKALQEYASAQDRATLLQLLLPVNKAATHSPWLKQLVDSGAIFRPIAWSPTEAHQFLRNIENFEAAGIVVRVPDWWKPHAPSRPQVQVKIGNQAAGLGLEAMLDFNVAISMDGEDLTETQIQQMLAAGDGLVRFKGAWVELDAAKLQGVLAHWKQVQADAGREGLSFLEGMRLLAGATLDVGAAATLDDAVADWSSITAGDWLKQALDGLRNPKGDATANTTANSGLKATLRPYQQDGVRWLWWLNRLGLGGCLADDMGLGKTVQVLALLLRLKAEHAEDSGAHLLVLPASLIANWQAEAARFAPSLRLYVAHTSARPAKQLALKPAGEFDVVLTSYGSLLRIPWLLQTKWAVVVLDEAQAIKNPVARQTKAAKALQSRVRLALTGTPVENRLGDLWSLFDFICPGLLGNAKTFSSFIKNLEKNKKSGYAPLRSLVQPYILRRLKSDKTIIGDLPDKTELKAYCGLSPIQASLYQQSVIALADTLANAEGMQRRGAVLAFLMRFKQICNHPSQWLGDGAYKPTDSGKFARLRELTEEIAARQEKVLVFTQFQEMTASLAEFLQTIFGRAGLVLHGGTPVKARKALVDEFQTEQGPPFFVLSIKAGGTGLTLTAAAHVIHFDRWWNPAVENQATDRAYRIGQKKNVLVHKFICRGTIEEKIDTMIASKLALSNDIIGGEAETSLTEMSNDALLKMVALDINSAMQE